jgi:hypothetical protein
VLTPTASPDTSRSKRDSRIFQGVSWSVSRPSGAVVSPVRVGDVTTLLIGRLPERSAFVDWRRRVLFTERRLSTACDRRRRRDEEMVPHGPDALGAEAICLQPLQPGPQSPFQERHISDVLPTPASPDERAFLSMPGRGVHDVAMGSQHSAPAGKAQGILWPGRLTYDAHCAVVHQMPKSFAGVDPASATFSPSDTRGPGCLATR